MKSERRHELQENYLANYLGHINRWIEPYSKPIAIGVVAIFVVAIGYSLYSSKLTGERSDATLSLMQETDAQDPAALEQVSVKYPAAPAAAWAELQRGSQLLARGTQELFLNREDAVAQLEDAKEAFQNALDGSKNQLVRSRAYYGMASVTESIGSIEDAIALYEDCIKVGESEGMVSACQDRITALSKPETQSFLSWFADQDFTPADPALPPSLPSGATLPDSPDMSMPDMSIMELEGGESDVELKDGLNLPEDAELPNTATDDDESTDDDAMQLQGSTDAEDAPAITEEPPAAQATELP